MRSLIRAFASRLNILWLLSYWLKIIWSVYAQKGAVQARVSLHLSKCHIVGNHKSRLECCWWWSDDVGEDVDDDSDVDVEMDDVIDDDIENTRWVSFDIKFTRQGFENACWHREACRAIQHAFSKPSLVNLISKDANLVFYLSVYPLLNTLQTSDYDVIFDFCVDSASLAMSFKKCYVIMTW